MPASLPRRGPALLAIALTLLAAVCAWGPVTSGDTFWHLTLGKATANEGWFCFPEPVGLSAVPTYCNHYWAWNLPAWLVWEGGGPTGLALLTALSAGAAAAAVFLLGRALLPGSPWTALALSALAVAGMHHRFVPRPQAAFLLLVPVALLLALRWRRTGAGVAVLAGLLLYWGHAHASVTIAPLIIGSLAFGVAWSSEGGLELEGWSRKRVLIFVGLGLLLLLGPKGVGILGLVAEHADSDIAEHVGEFQKMPPQAWWPPWDTPLALAELLVLLGGLGALRRRRVELAPLALALLGLAMTMNAVRFRAVWSVLALPWAAWGFVRRPDAGPEGLERRVLAVLASVIAAAVLLHDGPKPAGLERSHFPVGAAAALESVGFEGPVYTGHRAGGYIGWRLQGRAKIPIDGRAPLLFNDEEYFAARMSMAEFGPFRELDRRHRFEAAIVGKGTGTCSGLADDPLWTPVWVGEDFTLFGPTEGALVAALGPVQWLQPCGGGHGARCRLEPGYGARARAEARRLRALAPDEGWLARLETTLALQCPDGSIDEAAAALAAVEPRHPDRPWLEGLLAARRGDAEAALAHYAAAEDHLAADMAALELLRSLDRPVDAAPIARRALFREDDGAPIALRELGGWACVGVEDWPCAARQGIRGALLGSETSRDQLRALLQRGVVPEALVPVAEGLLAPPRAGLSRP